MSLYQKCSNMQLAPSILQHTTSVYMGLMFLQGITLEFFVGLANVVVIAYNIVKAESVCCFCIVPAYTIIKGSHSSSCIDHACPSAYRVWRVLQVDNKCLFSSQMSP